MISGNQDYLLLSFDNLENGILSEEEPELVKIRPMKRNLLDEFKKLQDIQLPLISESEYLSKSFTDAELKTHQHESYFNHTPLPNLNSFYNNPNVFPMPPCNTYPQLPSMNPNLFYNNYLPGLNIPPQLNFPPIPPYGNPNNINPFGFGQPFIPQFPSQMFHGGNQQLNNFMPLPHNQPGFNFQNWPYQSSNITNLQEPISKPIPFTVNSAEKVSSSDEGIDDKSIITRFSDYNQIDMDLESDEHTSLFMFKDRIDIGGRNLGIWQLDYASNEGPQSQMVFIIDEISLWLIAPQLSLCFNENMYKNYSSLKLLCVQHDENVTTMKKNLMESKCSGMNIGDKMNVKFVTEVGIDDSTHLVLLPLCLLVPRLFMHTDILQISMAALMMDTVTVMKKYTNTQIGSK